jgi:hypothetical protein
MSEKSKQVLSSIRGGDFKKAYEQVSDILDDKVQERYNDIWDKLESGTIEENTLNE